MRISDWSSDVCSSDLVCAGTIFKGKRSRHPGELGMAVDRRAGDPRCGLNRRNTCPGDQLARLKAGAGDLERTERCAPVWPSRDVARAHFADLGLEIGRAHV